MKYPEKSNINTRIDVYYKLHNYVILIGFFNTIIARNCLKKKSSANKNLKNYWSVMIQKYSLKN